MKKRALIALAITMVMTSAAQAQVNCTCTPVPPPAPTPAPAGSTLFQSYWTPALLQPISAAAKLTAVKGGLPHANFGVDVNYPLTTTNSDPIVNIIQDGDWANRSSGKNVLGQTHLPAKWTLPNPSGGDTPNNPILIVNTENKTAIGINGGARPTAGGPVYGYVANPPLNHGGSGILGGETTDAELKTGINHALTINVWGQKYLNKANGGYIAPAVKADSAYASRGSSDYYGSSLGIYMGSRVAIAKTVTAQSLGITSTIGKNLLAALQNYGGVIVDNSAWDCFYINATPDAEQDLYGAQADIKKLESVLQIVN